MKVASKRKCLKHLVYHEVEIPDGAGDRYEAWRAGLGYIQDALPELTPAEREILLTGTCQESWDEIFVDEECDDMCDGSSHPGLFCK